MTGLTIFSTLEMQESEKYCGHFVATRHYGDREVVCHGKNPVLVYNEALKKGIGDPIVFYVPADNAVQVYYSDR